MTSEYSDGCRRQRSKECSARSPRSSASTSSRSTFWNGSRLSCPMFVKRRSQSSVSSLRAANPAALKSPRRWSNEWLPMTVAETGSRAKRSSRKVLTVASSSVPTMTGATVWHRGDSHAARELSGLRELRSAVLPSPIHGGRDRLVLAQRRATDLPRSGDGHQDRRLAQAERRQATDVRVPGVRREEAAVHGVRITPRALPDL